MDAFDRDLKNILRENQTVLSAEKKAEIQKAMCRELQLVKQSPWQLLLAKVSLFWESTHQVSLAPVAVVCVVLVVAGAGIIRGLGDSGQPEPTENLYFVSQTDGGMQILPLAEDLEE